MQYNVCWQTNGTVVYIEKEIEVKMTKNYVQKVFSDPIK